MDKIYTFYVSLTPSSEIAVVESSGRSMADLLDPSEGISCIERLATYVENPRTWYCLLKGDFQQIISVIKFPIVNTFPISIGHKISCGGE